MYKLRLTAKYLAAIVIAIFFAFVAETQAQPAFGSPDTVPVTVNGVQLRNAWAGGLNFCQFSSIDLNLDGIKDLFVFDRSGDRVTTYLNGGTPNTVDYTFAPEYISRFPNLHDWALLTDYNCDGKEDIFSYSDRAGGMKVYKNISTTDSGLKFELVKTLVYSNYPTFANLYVSSVDIPALTDIDNDGDLDVLTFWVLGTYVEYHKNMSKELYGHCDSLTFELKNQCWGYFSESPTTNSVFIDDSCDFNVPNPEKTGDTGPTRHTGSSLLAFDANGDGVKELLLGDISFNNMVMLYNNGTVTNNHISSQDQSFPSYDVPVNLTIFPAAFYLDVDNDGLNDLIVSPNVKNASENFTSVHFYKNVGTAAAPLFDFRQNNFLQNTMIETGEGAYPTFFDYDSDGLLDLFIGNYGYYSPGPDPSMVSHYRNTGTLSAPRFELVTRDFANLSSLNLTAMVPSFGDLDGDNDADMLIGDYNGRIHYFENTASAGNPANFVLTQANVKSTSGRTIDVGSFAAPQIIDVNRDGKKDVIIGMHSGRMAYYRNAGGAFALDSVTHFFGKLSVKKINSSTGYSTPFMYNNNGSYRMLVGSESGFIYEFGNIDNNLAGTFTLLDSTFMEMRAGLRSAPAGGFLNNDNLLDIIVGNYAGGVSFFYNTEEERPLAVNEAAAAPVTFSLYPNPASGSVTIRIPEHEAATGQLVIINMLGQELMTEQVSAGSEYSLVIDNLPEGLYHCMLMFGNKRGVKKLIILHQ